MDGKAQTQSEKNVDNTRVILKMQIQRHSIDKVWKVDMLAHPSEYSLKIDHTDIDSLNIGLRL